MGFQVIVPSFPRSKAFRCRMSSAQISKSKISAFDTTRAGSADLGRGPNLGESEALVNSVLQEKVDKNYPRCKDQRTRICAGVLPY